MLELYSVSKTNNKFYIEKNSKQICFNDQRFMFDSKKEAEIFIGKIMRLNCEISTDLLALFYFSAKLNKNNIKNIKKLIIERLQFDNLLYLSPSDEELNEIIKKNYQKYLYIFENEFNLKFEFINIPLGFQKKMPSKKFKAYLNKLNTDEITVFFKFTQLTKSPILTYLFFEKTIDIEKFYDLSNFEDIYNEKKWGLTEEKEIANNNLKKTFKNLSNFFRLIS